MQKTPVRIETYSVGYNTTTRKPRSRYPEPPGHRRRCGGDRARFVGESGQGQIGELPDGRTRSLTSLSIWNGVAVHPRGSRIIGAIESTRQREDLFPARGNGTWQPQPHRLGLNSACGMLIRPGGQQDRPRGRTNVIRGSLWNGLNPIR